MTTLKKKLVLPAKEMAMPLPSVSAANIYYKYFTDPNEFPKPQVVEGAVREEFSNNPQVSYSISGDDLFKFATRTYPKLYSTVIYPLQHILWPIRNDRSALMHELSNHYFYYGRDSHNPEYSEDPIKRSLQNLKDWIYYYTSELYALMRPELLRQVNEIISIAGKSIKPQRITTPRSDIPTTGPAIKTPDISFEQVMFLGSPAWQVTSKVYTKGGTSTHIFLDFFDTQLQAKESPLAKEAYTLTPEQYLLKFKEYAQEPIINYQ